VFDPVAELKLNSTFYPLDEHLHIDLKLLEDIFKAGAIKLFVIIHYFGYVDPGYEEAVSLARKYKVHVLEDEAHSLYTDIVGGMSGRLGDAAIFSLHKMLPIAKGGVLCVNGQVGSGMVVTSEYPDCSVAFDYDFYSIAKKRRANAVALGEAMKKYSPEILPLRQSMKSGEIPQTYPVIIRNVSRDKIYEMMNASGYGVVSLYHTMIPEITQNDFPRSFGVSNRILNLPVHQDVEIEEIPAMVDALANCVASLKDKTA